MWRGGSNWRFKHEAWLAALSFSEPALATTLGHYRALVTARDAALAAVEADLAEWFDKAPFAEGVHRLGAHRGVTPMGALPCRPRSATAGASPGRRR